MSPRFEPAPRASAITPEGVYVRRREILRGIALGATAWMAGCGRTGGSEAAAAAPATSAGPGPGDGRPLAIASESAFNTSETKTSWRDVTTYNNYYEFGTGKGDPSQNAGSFKPEPWKVEIAGAAEKTGHFALEDLLKDRPLEERIYRHRCVERWSMVIPWVGFPLGDFLKRFRPTSQAKYVKFTTIARPSEMPGLAYDVLDWPYTEGLRIDEAMHPLTLLAVGLYGRTLPNQNGAPLRLVVPWKYGYKSIKSIVKIEFVETQPKTAWNQAAPDEYGFYSNVNPDVDHPRWSQKTERRIAGDGADLLGNRLATTLFNGYADQVASLYAGMDLRQYR